MKVVREPCVEESTGHNGRFQDESTSLLNEPVNGQILILAQLNQIFALEACTVTIRVVLVNNRKQVQGCDMRSIIHVQSSDHSLDFIRF